MLRSVITQGRQDWDQWVTSYTLQYSPDNVNHFYVRDVANNVGLFPGNTDRNTRVENFVPPGIVAKSVNLTVISWRQHISMRFDVTGCPVVGELPTIPTNRCCNNYMHTSMFGFTYLFTSITPTIPLNTCGELSRQVSNMSRHLLFC